MYELTDSEHSQMNSDMLPLVHKDWEPSSQVVYIIQAPRLKNIKEDYALTSASALGVVHIICALVAMAAEVARIVIIKLPPWWMSFSPRLWTSVFYFISGSLAITATHKESKCLLVATLAMSVVAAISAGVLIVTSSIFLATALMDMDNPYKPSLVPYVAEILMGVVMVVLATVSSSLTCRPLCCRSVTEPVVHYKDDQPVQDVHL